MSVRQPGGGSGAAIGGQINDGTSGSVVFVNPDNTLAQDNQNLYWDDTLNRLVVFGGLGTEILTNGTFTGSATGWTLASGWAYSSNSVSKTSNGTGTLSQSITARITSEYLLTYIISNWTVGTVTPSFGGVTGTAVSANGTYSEHIYATATTGLAFTPSNTARFTIDTISLKLMAPASSTKDGLSVGGINVQGSWSNGTPNTTRAMTVNNDGSYSWIDYRFGGALRASTGANSSGGYDVYTSGGNSFALYNGNSGLSSTSLYMYSNSTALVHYGYGEFYGGVVAGALQQPTSTLCSKGGLELKVKRATTSQTLDNTATHWLGDATTPVCTGTPSAACSSWTNQTDCEKWDAHGGCTWFAGNACSVFNNESGMGSCSGQAGCTVETASCVGPTDQTSCESQDDSYGGACSWGATGDCTLLDETTCGTTTGCTQNYTACVWADPDCTGNAACDAGDGTDQATCEAITYYTSCSGNYNACSGTYYTGTCSGTYGANCSGTSACSGIDDSTNCGNETGCSWVTAINFTLPDGGTCRDRTYWIKNDSSTGADVNILPYSGQKVEGQTGGITLSQYGQSAHLAYYEQTYDCSLYVTSGTCSAHTSGGCTVNNSACSWDGMNCSGNAVCVGIGDQTTCEATTYFSSCSGTEIIQKNWYIF